jgi:hypothetical protein
VATPYLPAWATLAEACEWLQAETGEPWPVARLLSEPVDLAVWLDPPRDVWPEALELFFAGRHEGFMAPLIFGGDTSRLAFEREGGTLTVTRNPKGDLVRMLPPVKFAAEELRASAESLRAIAQSIRAGRGAGDVKRVAFDFGNGAGFTTEDPHLLAMLRQHGPDALKGATVEVIGFEPQPAPPSPGADPEGGKKWTPERVAQARAIRDKHKADGHPDYMARTAAHYGVTPQRLRAVLRPEDTARPAPMLPPWPRAQRRR